MGEHECQPELFAYHVNLERRVRPDNPLRAVAQLIDFSFVRQEVCDLYGTKGNVSIDPVIILKLMFLLFFENLASERELMRILPERLDYLWFLGLGLDEEVPDHSVLSKARRRWGPARFESFFVRTIGQACESGLVSGDRLFADSTLIDADANSDKTLRESPNFPGFAHRLKELYAETENKLGEVQVLPEPSEPPSSDSSPAIAAPSGTSTTELTVNTTDPDAPLHKRQQLGKARPRYKNHRSVDPVCGIITATLTTGADMDDGSQLVPLIDQAQHNTNKTVTSACGDSHYGTHDNFRQLGHRGIQAHLAVRRYNGAAGAERKDENGRPMFGPQDFEYDAKHDRYTCPNGKHLLPKKWNAKRQAQPYRSQRSECQICPLLNRCTRAKNFIREVLRHDGQAYIDRAMKTQALGHHSVHLRQRMSLSEGSFADGTRHGLKRARWRRLWRVRIQNLLIAAVQNIKKIIKHQRGPKAQWQQARALERHFALQPGWS